MSGPRYTRTIEITRMNANVCDEVQDGHRRQRRGPPPLVDLGLFETETDREGDGPVTGRRPRPSAETARERARGII